MTCMEAGPHVSALYDHEPVPRDAAQHISNCEACRERLLDYARIGLETKLLAECEVAVPPVPASVVTSGRLTRKSRGGFFGGRILVPRFALAAVALCFVTALSAGWTYLKAQARPLWFQLEMSTEADGKPAFVGLGREGYKDQVGFMFNSRQNATHLSNLIGARFEVTSIGEGEVKIAAVARNYGQGKAFPANSFKEVGSLPTKNFAYLPGQTLQIPVEGGGELYIRGQVFDHQPKIAWGSPLEPKASDLFVRSPILIEREKRLITDLYGISAAADEDESVALDVRKLGKFRFALKAFPKAVAAESTWGLLPFDIEGKHYLLTAGAPLSGGNQPRKVWVQFQPNPETNTMSLGIEPIPVAGK
jgi:hypothetical protein